MKITRNISGNANVKNADAGLRQNDLFVNRPRSVRPPAHAVPCLSAGELQVDVLERRSRDLETSNARAALERPPVERVSAAGVVDVDPNDAVAGGDLADRRQVRRTVRPAGTGDGLHRVPSADRRRRTLGDDLARDDDRDPARRETAPRP